MSQTQPNSASGIDRNETATVGSTPSDPCQLILPDVDTSVALWNDLSADELAVYAPGVVVGLVGAFGVVTGHVLGWVGVGVGVIGLLAATALHVTTAPYETPRQYLSNWLHYRRLRLRLPWGDSETVDTTHGIDHLEADGSVVMRDGRRVALVAVGGTNADRLADDSEAALIQQLTRAIDEDIKDIPWAFYSTTRDASLAEMADRREQRARDAPAHAWGDLQQSVAYDAAEWLRDDDDAWDAKDWQHFVAVTVYPGEADTRSVGETLRSVVPGQRGRSDSALTLGDLLTDRVDRVAGALSSVDGLDVQRASPAVLADCGVGYWTGADHDPSESLLAAFETKREGDTTPAERLFAPEGFDVRGQTVDLGGTVARTFWIAEWPTTPDAQFLKDIVTADGVELDIKVYADPRQQRDITDQLERDIAKIDAEGMDRADETDVSAISVDDDLDAYTLAYSLFTNTNAQPWSLNAYVTVRAASETELDEACDDVRRWLEASPANTWPVAPTTRQRDAFRSSGPFARDYLGDDEPHRRKLCAGGALGAMFPFGVPTIHESEGIRFGRNTLTGEPVVADPFDRGTSPHLITLGKSRSGKTYGTSAGLAEWFLDRDDRTLIVCDTQGGFEGLTALCDGQHVVVDGTQGVNPLDIRPMPDHVQRATGGGYDAYRLKVDEATEFIAGTLQVDADKYRSTIEEAIEATYREAGITSDPKTHSKESPTMADFLDTLGGMVDNPESFTFTGLESEAATTERRAADLLDRLSGFREGKYAHLVGQTEMGVTPETRMAYLDLRQLQGQSDADQSVMLHLMLSQVSQLVKQTPGQTIFAIDEAHQLLHSPEMVEWLQQAAREWARFDAALHFISQSPREFIHRAQGVDAGQENNRETLVEQSAVLELYASPRTSAETLRQLGLNDELIRVAKHGLTPGKAGKGYSESLVQFSDHRGWVETWVEAPPLLDRVLTYSSRETTASVADHVLEGVEPGVPPQRGRE